MLVDATWNSFWLNSKWHHSENMGAISTKFTSMKEVNQRSSFGCLKWKTFRTQTPHRTRYFPSLWNRITHIFQFHTVCYSKGGYTFTFPYRERYCHGGKINGEFVTDLQVFSTQWLLECLMCVCVCVCMCVPLVTAWTFRRILFGMYEFIHLSQCLVNTDILGPKA
jgi:hypothetical protein